MELLVFEVDSGAVVHAMDPRHLPIQGTANGEGVAALQAMLTKRCNLEDAKRPRGRDAAFLSPAF